MILRHWLRLYLPLALIVALIFLGYARVQALQENELRINRDRTTLQLASESLSQELTSSAHDLGVIARTPAVLGYIETPSAEFRGYVESIMSAFTKQKCEYRQIRLLDDNGVELIRVDRTSEGPVVVPTSRLQDKSQRDYFTTAITLRPGVMHASRFDLNVEFGVIEKPINPTLRLSMRLQSNSGKAYVLVANLRGNVLLKGLTTIFAANDGESWMLDEAGYWLIHPDRTVPWGAQLNPQNRVQNKHPEIARHLGTEPAPFTVGTREYLTQRFRPLQDLVDNGYFEESPAFDLVISHHRAGIQIALGRYLIGLFVLILIALGLGCAIVVSLRERSAIAERERQSLLESNARDNAERAWIRDRIYQLSLKLSAARSAEQLGAMALEEIAPHVNLAAACIYVVRNRRSSLIAGYGLTQTDSHREFGLGEGLIGEVARTGVERRMTPPPQGYLDISAGLGQVPAAELRVLPLTMHGRTVAVIELALTSQLNQRQEEFLKQMLPLLALDLDGFHRSRRSEA